MRPQHRRASPLQHHPSQRVETHPVTPRELNVIFLCTTWNRPNLGHASAPTALAAMTSTHAVAQERLLIAAAQAEHCSWSLDHCTTLCVLACVCMCVFFVVYRACAERTTASRYLDGNSRQYGAAMESAQVECAKLERKHCSLNLPRRGLGEVRKTTDCDCPRAGALVGSYGCAPGHPVCVTPQYLPYWIITLSQERSRHSRAQRCGPRSSLTTCCTHSVLILRS